LAQLTTQHARKWATNFYTHTHTISHTHTHMHTRTSLEHNNSK